nr:hypothetical protein [uncultured Shinella sp.]
MFGHVALEGNLAHLIGFSAGRPHDELLSHDIVQGALDQFAGGGNGTATPAPISRHGAPRKSVLRWQSKSLYSQGITRLLMKDGFEVSGS